MVTLALTLPLFPIKTGTCFIKVFAKEVSSPVRKGLLLSSIYRFGLDQVYIKVGQLNNDDG